MNLQLLYLSQIHGCYNTTKAAKLSKMLKMSKKVDLFTSRSSSEADDRKWQFIVDLQPRGLRRRRRRQPRLQPPRPQRQPLNISDLISKKTKTCPLYGAAVLKMKKPVSV